MAPINFSDCRGAGGKHLSQDYRRPHGAAVECQSTEGQPHTSCLLPGPAAMHVEEMWFAGTGNSYKLEKGIVPCGPEADKPEV